MLLDFDQSPVSQNSKYEQKITSNNSDMETVEIDNDSEPTPRPAKKKSQTSDSEDGDVGPGEAFKTPLTLKRPAKVRKWSLYDSSSLDSGESPIPVQRAKSTFPSQIVSQMIQWMWTGAMGNLLNHMEPNLTQKSTLQ